MALTFDYPASPTAQQCLSQLLYKSRGEGGGGGWWWVQKWQKLHRFSFDSPNKGVNNRKGEYQRKFSGFKLVTALIWQELVR